MSQQSGKCSPILPAEDITGCDGATSVRKTTAKRRGNFRVKNPTNPFTITIVVESQPNCLYVVLWLLIATTYSYRALNLIVSRLVGSSLYNWRSRCQILK